MNNQRKLIVESYKLSKLTKIETPTINIPKGCMLIEGVMGRVDSFNRNNRFYKKDDYAQRLVEFNQRIENEGGILGEMEHPKTMNIDLNNVSHKILNVRIDEDGFVRGQVLLLNTTKGRDAQAIVESGTPLPISSRATGRVMEDKSVQLESFATWDLVGTAGFQEASMSRAITESYSDENGEIVMESFAWDLDENGRVVYESKEEKNEKTMDEKQISELVERLVSEKLEKGGYVHESKINSVVETKDNEELIEEIIEKIDERFALTYAPMLESWVKKDFKNKIMESMKSWTINEFAPIVEKWTVNEFAPIVEKWVINDFAQVVETWVVNEYSPIVENWINGDFKNALVAEHVTPMKTIVVEAVEDETKEVVEGIALTNAGEPIATEFGKGNFEKDAEKFNSAVLSKVDELINKSRTHVDDSMVDKKPTSSETTKTATVVESVVDKAVFENAPQYIQLMPQNMKLIWQTLNENKRAEIQKRASIRLLTTVEQIQEFWNQIDVNQIVESNINQSYNRNVVENINESAVVETNPRMVYAKMAVNMRK